MKERFLNSCINFITKYNDYTEKNIKKLRYGLEGLYLTITKCFIIFLISIFFNFFIELLIIVFLYNLLRFFGFGFHAEKSWQCLIISIILFDIIPFIILKLSFNLNIIIICSIVCLIGYLLWAPADTVKRPLKNKKKKLMQKICILLLGIIYMSIAMYFDDFSEYFISAMIIELLLVSPLFYLITRQPFNNGKQYLA